MEGQTMTFMKDAGWEEYLKDYRKSLESEWDRAGKYTFGGTKEITYFITPELKRFALSLGKSKDDVIQDIIKEHLPKIKEGYEFDKRTRDKARRLYANLEGKDNEG
jgi:hypothetical protein